MRINNQAGQLESVKDVELRRIKAEGLAENVTSTIVCEHFMELTVDEKTVAKLVCTPTNLVELTLGRLLTEGIISNREEVESIDICEGGSRAKVCLKKDGFRQRVAEQEPEADWKAEWVFALAHAFAEDSKLHRETNGTHSCYLGKNGKLVFSCEDIGRHNAMDKCIGYAVLEGLERKNCMLFTTGRVSADMVRKAAAAGIPALVSKAVPTDAAIAIAKEYHLTLICKAWPDSFVIVHEGSREKC